MAKIKNSKNNTWTHIFEQAGTNILKNINDNGFYDITADDLRAYSADIEGPDVRNLVKFDKILSLPDVFKDGSNSSHEYINIMPIGNVDGKGYVYRLGRFNAYEPLEILSDQKPEMINYPEIETVTQKFLNENGVSENTYIDLAYTSGMINKNFETTLDNPLMPVMHGRLRSGEMEFRIGTNPSQIIKTGSSQLEVDATFENKDSIVIIEAKSVAETDFLVRQLFYPYYVINHRGVSKSIRPTFLLLQEGNYYFNEYTFENEDNYSTIRLINQRSFRFRENNKLTLDLVENMLNTSYEVTEPNVPFPQANKRSTFVKVLSLLDESNDDNAIQQGLTSKQISEGLGYAGRQGDYYGNLAIYLGLASKEATRFILNEEGAKLLTEFNTNTGRINLIKKLLKHQPFRIAIKWFLQKPDKIGEQQTKKFDESEIGELIKESGGLRNVTTDSSTFWRRVQSIISFVKSALIDIVDE